MKPRLPLLTIPTLEQDTQAVIDTRNLEQMNQHCIYLFRLRRNGVDVAECRRMVIAAIRDLCNVTSFKP